MIAYPFLRPGKSDIRAVEFFGDGDFHSSLTFMTNAGAYHCAKIA